MAKGRPPQGQKGVDKVEAGRTKRIARHHSAAHLLNPALRTVLGSHVGQAGSWVGEDRVRFDFTHGKALSAEEMRRVEALVNQDILSNYPADITEMPIDEAKKTGAVAAFEENYGDIVRVVTLGPSKEFCGGTHGKATGVIGPFYLEV